MGNIHLQFEYDDHKLEQWHPPWFSPDSSQRYDIHLVKFEIKSRNQFVQLAGRTEKGIQSWRHSSNSWYLDKSGLMELTWAVHIAIRLFAATGILVVLVSELAFCKALLGKVALRRLRLFRCVVYRLPEYDGLSTLEAPTLNVFNLCSGREIEALVWRHVVGMKRRP